MKRRSSLLVVILMGVLCASGEALAPQQTRLATQARATLSTLQGTLKLPGLRAPVTVIRDRWGVPHIYAQNEHDLFFAQGYVAAQDRLFQMELWKRSGQGRLAEILGPSALPRDVYARLLEYRGNMQAEYASYSPDTHRILEAFTAGINAYIARRMAPGGKGLPIEFRIAGFKPEPWRPRDCLNRMAAFSMMNNAIGELQHAEAVAKLGVARADKLFDLDPHVEFDPAPGVDYAGLSPKLLTGLVGTDTRIGFPRDTLEGSNDWAVSGKMTTTGMPLLANDPHRVLAEPSLRYMVQLVAPGWDVEGAGEPALPGVAVGHNRHIAWGFTIFGEDQEDFYVEQLNPRDPLEYKTPSGWARMKVIRTTFHVRGRPDVTMDLKFTRHGPVLWSDGHRALALRWIGAEPGTAGYLGALAVDRAENWAQFEAATARWKVPSENLVYADTKGNIGMYSVGLAPIRKNWTGLLPVPGDGKYEWAGFVPDSELPHSFNGECHWCLRPALHYTASANQRMIPENYPYKIGFLWAPGSRYRRILQVLGRDWKSGRKVSVADMENLQNDQVSLPARALLPMLRRAIGPNPTPAQKLLAGWNGVVNTGAAPALFELWLRGLTRVVRLRVVPGADEVPAAWPSPLLLKYLSHPTAAVFGANPVEGRNRVMLQALRAAQEKLERLQGPNPAKWSWGELHTLTFRNPLDALPGSRALLDEGPIPRPGDDYTIDAQYFNGPGPFRVLAGSSYKEIFSLANWDGSVAINVPGQSGQPASPDYRNLLPLWRTGRYFPLAFSKKAVGKAAAQKLVLEP